MLLFPIDASDGEGIMELWHSKWNSFSSILFQRYDVLEKLPNKKYLVACKFCDVNRPPKLVTHGNNSNLKSHISRVCILFDIFNWPKIMRIHYIFIKLFFFKFQNRFMRKNTRKCVKDGRIIKLKWSL